MVQQSGSGRRAEIAGAGIGGLTVAAALAQRGWSVTVHERAPNLRTFGAGIYIWSNGLRVLKAIGAYDQATIGAHIGPVFHTRDHHDTTMEEIPINRPGGARLITILRETLINALVDACRRSGVDILTNSEAVGATPEGELLLADGSKRPADLVVGADGVNSQVRDSLDLMMYRKSLGYGAIRMLIARDDGDVCAGDRDRYIEYFTGTRRILYTPASATDLYVALCCASDDKQALQVPADRALWTQSFPHLAPLVARFGDAGRWDEFEVIKLKAWSKGRVAILGDAAHAMPPYLGQGGGCALMNGIGLAAAVADAPDVAQALRDWEARERPMTEHTQDTAERLGDMNFWPDDVRSQVLKITGQCREIAMERMKTALYAPTATQAL
ncbi:MAG TPA: NAD(P)/FAD-dependent oxidoreductase [Beijerinckiaceae bacterium]|jgi:2-polyprenyl-6-methoxyphenol hydroxylase-like FAD-dependent oxidoreductase|nr:NAD(P)/FAD-dependent oxidoreductase [Beijerinckiaceae bacterium]